MSDHPAEPIAIVGVSAIMPDAPDAAGFWNNIKSGRYSISDVPPGRWDPSLYYDPDPHAPDKTYSRIGGWVREFEWEPVTWHLPIPPKVAEQMDEGQRWAITAARAALLDAGWPDWDVDPERVAVILGNAIGGEKHYATNMRIQLPEVLRDLEAAPSFAGLPDGTRQSIVAETRKSFLANYVEITEDTMPGELANVLAGRIANLFNFRGPNFTTDAACASGLAGVWSAALGLAAGDFDAAIAGGIDRNMGVAAFVKFCKIGALSATGTRPFDAGADGFVMGEGAALFVLKRLADAERAGDRIYAVLLGIAGSSDGKGKGITAPNPAGQRLAIENAWRRAGVDPASASSIEAHGTSTRVGDASELESLSSVFGPAGAATGSIALGSVKSNIGHLKAAAGTAGLFKMVMSLHEKVLAPSLHFAEPNPKVDWARSPFRVNSELRDWPAAPEGVRRGGVSAFGFGGTNFHAVLEEYVPGRHKPDDPRVFAGAELGGAQQQAALASPSAAAASVPAAPRAPLRGALVLGGASEADIATQLRAVQSDAAAGHAPAPAAPDPALATAALRLAIDYADAGELATKADKALKAFAAQTPAMWRMLRAQGIFLGRGGAPKVAFLYTGQGSQYVNMLQDLRSAEPIVASTFAEADRIMTPLLGRPLSSYVFIDGTDPEAVAQLERQLLQTEITQPAVLTSDLALTRLLDAYGVRPDMVMGHSLGEYGALVAAGALDFPAALEAVSARGREMASLQVEDNGAMAAVFGPLETIEQIVSAADGYVVIANVNSFAQAVVGGATDAVERVIETFRAAGLTAQRIPVSHAFHTSIVAPASAPLQDVLRRLDVHTPRLPIVANVNGEFYPADAGVEDMLDILGRQVASPVQFVKGLQTLYAAGARVFVEVGPKKALHGFVEDVLGAGHDDVLALFTNHPKLGDAVSFNQALCGLYSAGLGFAPTAVASAPPTVAAVSAAATASHVIASPVTPSPTSTPLNGASAVAGSPAEPRSTMHKDDAVALRTDEYVELGHIFADFLDRGRAVLERAEPAPAGSSRLPEPVVVTGAGLGLPGVERVFDDENLVRILDGESFIDAIPHRLRQAMVDMHITRLVKPESGEPSFVTIDDEAHVVKLAGRSAPLDLVGEFGVEQSRDVAMDSSARLAVGAGIDALRDAGIPLVMRYHTTTLGTQLPDRWGLPEELRDDTGVIFASAFPGYGEFARDVERSAQDRARRSELAALQAVRARLTPDESAAVEADRRIAELQHLLTVDPFEFDRRFLFRCLSMGHSQFAELIGARGPNTQINSACASTTQAVCIAEDWIRAGRCRRVVVIAGDDATNDELLPWLASGFLASGAAATDDVVADAATPFDRRRHGMIVGMGAAALVIESAQAARERGIQPICEVLGAVTANSAFHGTRLDVDHVSQVMERVVSQAEARGVDRHAMAGSTAFVSHETYTPARGGSAAAEITALRSTFGASADQVVITNTKGFTGHAMGAGIEDVIAVRALETGIVPPVPNFKEPDPDLGELNLSKGGSYPVEYALRLAAGFGSQIAMTVLRWTPMPDRARRSPDQVGFRHRIADRGIWQSWLERVSGQAAPELEVVQHRLRVVDRGARAVQPSAAPAVAVTATPIVVAPMTTAAPGVAPAPSTPAAAPAAAVAVAAPVAAAVAAPVAVADEVTDAVVSIVAQMTGYPTELLDLDLDLEADLGVDTVKQAEVFAAVRERFGVEREENLQLRDFPTLTHVIGWVRDKTGLAPAAPAAAVAVAAPVAAAVAAPVAVADEVTDAVVSIVAQMTGYPTELLDLDLDLEADLGVDTVKQAEVFAAVRERFGVEREENLQLRDFPTLTHVIGWVRDKTGLAPAAPAAAAAVAVAAPVAAAVAAPVAVADEVTDAVVSIVAQMTGYPTELLDLDLDLEADLGVDTVKQAEVFAAVRERFGVEREENLQLRDFPTLTHVIGWVRDKTGLAPAAPAAAVAVAAPVAAAVAAPVAVADEVTDAVVSIVAQMTGYPTELLDLDLDLEADLGVDTVKQAEVFAAVRERFGVEREENLQLRDFPTLTHVIGWVRDKTGLAPAAPAAPGQAPDAVSERAPEAVSEQPSAVVGELAATDRYPRRVPKPELRPSLDLCVPTGVTLGAGQRVVVMHDEGGVGRALVKRLAKLGATPLELAPGLGTDALNETLTGWLADGPVDGVYWLAGLDDEGPVEDMDLAGWREALRRRVKNLYATMRPLSGVFLVAATRFGGYHGYDDGGASAPLGGAVCGFSKAYKREQPEALVKVVDFPRSRKTAPLADTLVAETLADPGCVEVGHAEDGLRWTVGLVEEAFAAGIEGFALDSNTVTVVTGAAGSIVSAITADLAAASGGVFHLLDLTPEPDPADEDLQAYLHDKDALKPVLAARMSEHGQRPTPVAIEHELAGLERRAAALAAIRAVIAAGGSVHYHQVDLTSADAVAQVMSSIRATSGRIDLLLHAAGLEISRALADKEPREYDLVFDVKSDGWFNLMHAAGDMPLGATVAFSSVAGRFGNAGQTDYSAANDLLCKMTSNMRRSRPGTRAIALDWTAWGGIGMATRGSIPKIMQMAGIETLDPAAGIAWIRRELTSGNARGEVVVAGALGLMTEEFHETGGLDTGAVLTDATGPMIGTVQTAGLYSGLVTQVTLDPRTQPFLDDHRIDSIAVLPGVMGLEGFAELARLLVPGRQVAAIENVEFLAPVKFYRDEPRTITLRAHIHPAGSDLVATCALEGDRILAGTAQAQHTVHFTASVRLTTASPTPEQAVPVSDAAHTVGSRNVYELYFHGPAYQVVAATWPYDGGNAARMADALPDDHVPMQAPTVVGPRLVELCFQTAGLWEAAEHGRLALPRHVDRVRLLRDPQQVTGAVYAVARESGDHFDCSVLDADGAVVLCVEGYRTIALPSPVPDEVRHGLTVAAG